MKYLRRMVEINKIIDKLKSNFTDFIKKLGNEGRETKEVFDLILKESRGELLDEFGNKRELTPEEVVKIKEQASDFFKMIGLTSISILPGGTLVFILLKVFKQEERILPSSFLSDEQKTRKLKK